MEILTPQRLHGVEFAKPLGKPSCQRGQVSVDVSHRSENVVLRPYLPRFRWIKSIRCWGGRTHLVPDFDELRELRWQEWTRRAIHISAGLLQNPSIRTSKWRWGVVKTPSVLVFARHCLFFDFVQWTTRSNRGTKGPDASVWLAEGWRERVQSHRRA